MNHAAAHQQAGFRGVRGCNPSSPSPHTTAPGTPPPHTAKSDSPSAALSIDASKLGCLIDRIHHELSDEEIGRIADTYHNWRKPNRTYGDIPGIGKSATLDEIRGHGYVITLGGYIGAEKVEDDGESLVERTFALLATLGQPFEEFDPSGAAIKKSLGPFGFKT